MKSVLHDVNHYIPHTIFNRKCRRQYSLVVKQKELFLAQIETFLFNVSERDPRDYFACSTSCILQLICLNNRKLVKMCKAKESLYVTSLDRQTSLVKLINLAVLERKLVNKIFC